MTAFFRGAAARHMPPTARTDLVDSECGDGWRNGRLIILTWLLQRFRLKESSGNGAMIVVDCGCEVPLRAPQETMILSPMIAAGGAARFRGSEPSSRHESVAGSYSARSTTRPWPTSPRPRSADAPSCAAPASHSHCRFLTPFILALSARAMIAFFSAI
jgi:hypothetical protein